MMDKYQFGINDFLPEASMGSGRGGRHFAVFSVADILHVVGLVPKIPSITRFKLVWPYALFYNKLDGRIRGTWSDLK